MQPSPSNIFLALKKASGALATNGDSLQFEMAAAQKSRRSDEFARGQILRREVALINGVELVEETQVRAGNLYVYEIVHSHSGLRQGPFEAVEHQLDFILDLGRRLTSFGIQSNSPRQIQGITGKNPVTERRLYGFFRRVESFARGLAGGRRKRFANGKNTSNNKDKQQKSDATIHGCLHSKPPRKPDGRDAAGV